MWGMCECRLECRHAQRCTLMHIDAGHEAQLCPGSDGVHSFSAGTDSLEYSGGFFELGPQKENVLIYRENTCPRHPSFFFCILTSLSSSI